jgi:hypothetical protein
MVSSVSSSTGSISNWADSIYSKLDTKNQGYIEESDLASALSSTGVSDSDSSSVADMFSALDGDSDGKVTKSELTEAMTKVSDQLNAQFDASRVQGGMPPAGGMHGAGGPRGGGGASETESTESTDGTSSTSTDYVAAADTDGDGTVSDAEQAAYDKKVASGEIDESGNSTASTDGTDKPAREKDPMRELAHALNLLKAYAQNSGSSDSSTASTSATSSVSVEA